MAARQLKGETGRGFEKKNAVPWRWNFKTDVSP